jgi:hypothetical protein
MHRPTIRLLAVITLASIPVRATAGLHSDPELHTRLHALEQVVPPKTKALISQYLEWVKVTDHTIDSVFSSSPPNQLTIRLALIPAGTEDLLKLRPSSGVYVNTTRFTILHDGSISILGYRDPESTAELRSCLDTLVVTPSYRLSHAARRQLIHLVQLQRVRHVILEAAISLAGIEIGSNRPFKPDEVVLVANLCEEEDYDRVAQSMGVTWCAEAGFPVGPERSANIHH